jgi:hypothetical protein
MLAIVFHGDPNLEWVWPLSGNQMADTHHKVSLCCQFKTSFIVVRQLNGVRLEIFWQACELVIRQPRLASSRVIWRHAGIIDQTQDSKIFATIDNNHQ